MADAAAIERGKSFASNLKASFTHDSAGTYTIQRRSLGYLIAYIESLEAKERKLDLAMTALHPEKWSDDMQRAFLEGQERTGVSGGFDKLRNIVAGADLSGAPTPAEKRQAEDTPERKAILLLWEALGMVVPGPGYGGALSEILQEIPEILNRREQS